MYNSLSIWDEEDSFGFSSSNASDSSAIKEASKLIQRASNLKTVSTKSNSSKNLSGNSLLERLEAISYNVHRILGVYESNTITIRTREQLKAYIDASIANGIISIDTETNNSLDPISCKLMGPCIYTPGEKNAYIPINHVNPITRELLPNQLTEEDIREEFSRLSDTTIIMHNGKFDYQVIKCTCHIPLHLDWDTLIGARLLNENERAGLKEQYINKIDPSIEKYSIEHLFKNVEYAVVDPEIFALYAATDAFMTYKLYLYQKEQFERSGHEGIFYVFKEIEMPVVIVTAEMELAGVSIDIEYATRLSKKYHDKSYAIDNQILAELEKYEDKIAAWRQSPAANECPTTKAGKSGKSKNQQLESPPSIASPTQLAILLYDVLEIPMVDKDSPRGTGEDILLMINEKYDIPLCKLILEKRGIEKLIGTYIDKLPECVSPVDHRLHAHFNQYGADTGRFSSSDPNL